MKSYPSGLAGGMWPARGRRAGTRSTTTSRDRLVRLALTSLLAGALAAASAACDDKGEDMRTRAPEQAIAETKELAEKTRSAAGVDTLNLPNENVSPCEGKLGELSDMDEVYYIHGSYQLLVPAEEQPDVLARVREQWLRDGLTIKRERSFGPGEGGEVDATAGNGYSLSLSSGKPPAMLLVVSSPCYRR